MDNESKSLNDYFLKDNWINKYWRPMMAWQYFIVCIYDFIIGPQLFYMMQTTDKIVKWTPLTLEGGGLYHLSMAAIIGVTAWTRGQEKLQYMQASFFGNNPSYGPNFNSGMMYRTTDTITPIRTPNNVPYDVNVIPQEEQQNLPPVRKQPL